MGLGGKMITLWKAHELPSNDPLFKFALPKGFPFLVVERDESIEIQEHVLLYLYEKFVRGRGRRSWKKNTAEGYAYDLRDWFAFLEVCDDESDENSNVGKAWDAATEDDYINYRDALQDAVSPHTKQHLADSTIRRRQSTVENFYREAQKRGWYVGAFLKTSEFKKGRIRPADTDAMVHLRAGRDTTREISPYAEEVGETGVVHPLSMAEWRGVQRELGTLPSELKENSRPYRDRLACELSLTTGLRVDEAASLTVHHILKLNTDYLLLSEEDREYGYLKLYITKTKRLKPRNVLVPCYLIPELVRYIDGERKATVSARKASAKHGKKYKEPDSLFVNHAYPLQHAGSAIQPASLSHAFRQACKAAGVMKTVQEIHAVEDDEGNETKVSVLRRAAAHCYHDLRHTFAVTMYFNEVDNRNPEPWLPIKELLGHTSVETTRDIYLKVVTIEEKARAGKVTYRAKQRIGGNHD
jgi:integrase/recombinase XerC